MKKNLMPYAFFVMIILFSGCEDEDSSSILGSYKKQRVNFYGTLTTHQGISYEVENISIDGHIKEIPVYEPIVAQAKSMVPADFQLKINPKDDAVTKIDLVGINEIRVPNPERIWKYQKPGTTTPATEFVEIEVVSNNETRSMNKYLIEASKQINVYQKDLARSLAKNVPFRALKSLTIKGHLDRNAQEEEEKKTCSLLQQASQGKKHAPSNVKNNTTSTPTQNPAASCPACPPAIACPAPITCATPPPCPTAITCPAPAPCPVPTPCPTTKLPVTPLAPVAPAPVIEKTSTTQTAITQPNTTKPVQEHAVAVSIKKPDQTTKPATPAQTDKKNISTTNKDESNLLGKSRTSQDLIEGRAPEQESNDQISRLNRDNSSF